MTAILPGTIVSPLSVSLIGGNIWDLGKQSADNFTMIIFYRGYHCPKCQEQLEELQSTLNDFKTNGVEVLALSMDSQERAQKTSDEWDITGIPLGYGLTEEGARAWGLYMSQKMEKDASKIQEPQIFNEPGLFLVRPDGTLYSASVQTMPFARPHFKDVLSAIKFVNKSNYPPRGDLK